MDNQTLFFQIFNLGGKNQTLDQIMIFGAIHLIYLAYILGFVLAIRKPILFQPSWLGKFLKSF